MEVILQDATNDVEGQVGPGVTQMAEIIDGRAAGVPGAGASGFDSGSRRLCRAGDARAPFDGVAVLWDELLLRVSETVVKLQLGGRGGICQANWRQSGQKASS